MKPSAAQLTRIRHMSSISKWTNDNNRSYHHAMIDATFVPIVDMMGIREWKNKAAVVTFTYDEAREFYNEHGIAPVPFQEMRQMDRSERIKVYKQLQNELEDYEMSYISEICDEHDELTY